MGCLDYAILGARSKRQISEAELSRWRLVEEFEERLERAAAVGKSRTPLATHGAR
jgi:hypothetical protein